MDLIELTTKNIEIEKYYQKIIIDYVGAICCFSGIVRQDKNKKICHLFYEAYIKLAKKNLAKIVTEIKNRYPVKKIVIVHRLGKVKPSECSLFVAMSSPHRKEGFLACEYCVEMIKKKIPIWKKEVFKDGSFQWK